MKGNGNTPDIGECKMMEMKRTVEFEKLEPHDRIKYEIAEELGLLDKVREGGWKALSSKETGKIGGMISRRKKALEKSEKESG